MGGHPNPKQETKTQKCCARDTTHDLCTCEHHVAQTYDYARHLHRNTPIKSRIRKGRKNCIPRFLGGHVEVPILKQFCDLIVLVKDVKRKPLANRGWQGICNFVKKVCKNSCEAHKRVLSRPQGGPHHPPLHSPVQDGGGNQLPVLGEQPDIGVFVGGLMDLEIRAQGPCPVLLQRVLLEHLVDGVANCLVRAHTGVTNVGSANVNPTNCKKCAF